MLLDSLGIRMETLPLCCEQSECTIIGDDLCVVDEVKEAVVGLNFKCVRSKIMPFR